MEMSYCHTSAHQTTQGNCLRYPFGQCDCTLMHEHKCNRTFNMKNGRSWGSMARILLRRGRKGRRVLCQRMAGWQHEARLLTALSKTLKSWGIFSKGVMKRNWVWRPLISWLSHNPIKLWIIGSMLKRGSHSMVDNFSFEVISILYRTSRCLYKMHEATNSNTI